MKEISLLESTTIKHIHFVGIGGISMSGLAEILLSLGYKISGSDMKSSYITERLGKLGATVYTGHDASNVQGADLVVYTAAAKEDNVERVEAGKRGIPSMERATLLGQVMKKYPVSIAISGTHGKTTTTSMVSMIMLEAALDPTIHIGGVLDAIGGTTKIGGEKYFITEACEYVESFLKFHPFLAVVLNIELDHVDYFKDIQHIKDAFYKFVSLVPQDGYVVACVDDGNTAELVKKVSCNTVTYGIKSSDAMWSAKNITFDNTGCASFILTFNKEELGEIKLSVPGTHNVNNALGAAAACHTLGCDIRAIRRGLNKFHGTDKRFQTKGTVDEIRVVDDYAHHPSEIKVTLKAARNCGHPKVWCVFQPHTYTRTKAFMEDFASSFEDADEIIIADIYAAREIDKGDVHSSTLAEKIQARGKKALYINGFDSIVDYLDRHVAPGDLVITMGAGDISKAGEMFLDKRKEALSVS